jgi:hypothetical protein
MIEMIKEATKNCKSEDCAVTVRGGGTQTLVVYTPTFDKNGMVSSRDPNVYSTRLECVTCGMKWDVTQGGPDIQMTVKEVSVE